MTGRAERLARCLAPVAVATAVSAWFFQPFIASGDLFWHLASGREIVARGSVPKTDPFSYTFLGEPWQNHEWLWDVVYWTAYDLHPDVVAWLNLGVLFATFGLTFVAARKVSGSTLAAGLAVWAAAATSHWFLDVRPHLFTLLFTSLLIATRDRDWAPWTWPLLMLLWVNLHAGFVFGLGAIGVIVLVRTVEASWSERRLVIDRRAWICLGLSLVAWLGNPWGWRIVEYPLAYADATIFRHIIEWRPVPLGLDPRDFEGRFWCLVIVCVAGLLMGGERRRVLFALCCVTLAMAITSRRFIPLFSIVAAPLAALAIVRLRDATVRSIPALGRGWAGVCACVLALALAASMWDDVRLGPGLLHRWAVGDEFPEAAVRYLNAMGPPRRVLNEYVWGGYIMFHAPGALVFIDGRANTLYDAALFDKNLDFQAGRVTPAALGPYAADVALVRKESPFAMGLLRLRPAWQPVYEDSNAIIFVAQRPATAAVDLPDPREIPGNRVQLLLRRARDAVRAGQPRRAIGMLEEAISLRPETMSAYRELARVQAGLGDVLGVDRTIERGIRSNPRRREHLRMLETRAWLAAGEMTRARAAFERASSGRGPFGTVGDWNSLVRGVEFQALPNATGEP